MAKTDFVKVDNFYLPDETLKYGTPSRKDGVDEETEAMQRIYGCEVIQACGVCLGFPQVVMATGQVLLHRFYCKRSMRQFDIKVTALTCFWLAAKLEEVPKLESNMWKVLIVFDRVTRRKDGKDPKLLELHSKKYYLMRDEVVRTERELLVAFGFVMHVEHPHKHVMNYLTALSRSKNAEVPPTEKDEQRVAALMQTAINYVNDSLRTMLCVRFKAEVVACAAIFLAARELKISLPESDDPEESNWWDLFDVRLEDIVEVCVTILGLYSLPKAYYTPLAAPPPGTIAKKRPAMPSRGEGGGSVGSVGGKPAAADPFDTPPGSMVSGGGGPAVSSASALPKTPPRDGGPKKTPPLQRESRLGKNQGTPPPPPAGNNRNGEPSSRAASVARDPPPLREAGRDRPKGEPPRNQRDRERGREADRDRERAREREREQEGNSGRGSGATGRRGGDRDRDREQRCSRDARGRGGDRYSDNGAARQQDSRRDDSDRERKRPTPPAEYQRKRDGYSRSPKRQAR
mmetsp:Transcript_22526/g.62492  ORF Transcript_22526/g.62492 Transcript_22526/m.62492 type:complete len:516 (-) Transcript_22526:652-2199(-)